MTLIDGSEATFTTLPERESLCSFDLQWGRHEFSPISSKDILCRLCYCIFL